MTAKINCILPTLEFTFERSSKPVNNESQDNLVSNLTLEVSLKQNPDSAMIIGDAKSKTLQQIWKGNDSSDLSFDLTTDNYSLSQIEKIRNGSDLCLSFLFKFRAFVVNQPSTIQQYTLTIEQKVDG